MKVEEVFRRTRRMVHAWLAYADERTLLLPDVLPGHQRGPKGERIYRPHNSGADNYPYLVATAWFTDRALYDNRLRHMLRNEVRYTTAPDGIPSDLDLASGTLGPPSLFGAAEYAKDGLIAITELLGRTPWFYRMSDMTAALMSRAPVASDFGPLPDAGAETERRRATDPRAPRPDDRRPPLPRVGRADRRRVRARGPPPQPRPARLHVGLRAATRGPTACACATTGTRWSWASPSSRRSRPSAAASAPSPTARRSAAMLDRILASANPDGLLYDEIRPSDLAPLSTRLSDNWGYVYGAVYTHYMVTGEERYREAVRRVLAEPDALPRPRLGGREPGRLRRRDRERHLPREPRAGARGARLDRDRDRAPHRLPAAGRHHRALVRRRQLGAHAAALRDDEDAGRLPRRLEGGRRGSARCARGSGSTSRSTLPPAGRGRLRFDHARHRRDMNFTRNWVRLNEWPEWYTVDENTLYRLRSTPRRRAGPSRVELITGIAVSGSGRWTRASGRTDR